MKMSELILKYGDENVKFQNLDTSADSLNMGKKGIDHLRHRPAHQPQGATEMLGLVLWFDRERVAKIMAELKKESPAT